MNAATNIVSITYVKKILSDGEPCKRCKLTDYELKERGYDKYITNIVKANEDDIDSEGVELAIQHGADSAPFFIVYYHTAEGITTELFENMLSLRLNIFEKLDNGDLVINKEASNDTPSD